MPSELALGRLQAQQFKEVDAPRIGPGDYRSGVFADGDGTRVELAGKASDLTRADEVPDPNRVVQSGRRGPAWAWPWAWPWA